MLACVRVCVCARARVCVCQRASTPNARIQRERRNSPPPSLHPLPAWLHPFVRRCDLAPFRNAAALRPPEAPRSRTPSAGRVLRRPGRPGRINPPSPRRCLPRPLPPPPSSPLRAHARTPVYRRLGTHARSPHPSLLPSLQPPPQPSSHPPPTSSPFLYVHLSLFFFSPSLARLSGPPRAGPERAGPVRDPAR